MLASVFYELVCVLVFDFSATHTHTQTLLAIVSVLFLSHQLHMGKQAEEQQKYGERVRKHFELSFCNTPVVRLRLLDYCTL